MACGNNQVSRSGLHSDPAPLTGPAGPAPTSSQLTPEQVAVVKRQARSAMEQAERKASAAATPAAASDAVKEAQRALDVARRMRGSMSERAALVRDLERKLESVERVAKRVQRDQELVSRFQAADQLRRSLLGVPAHLTARSATPAERQLARGYAQVADKPRNSKYAGQRFPMEEKNAALAAKYPDSVHFDAQGFPDFSPYAVASVSLPQLPGDRPTDFKEADARTGWTEESRAKARLTWHHHQDGKTMLLVPTDLHNAIGHHGGIAHETRVASPERLVTNYLIHSMQELLEPEDDN